MYILRICHTFPSESLPGASIQQIYIDKFSRFKSIYFIRDQNSELISKIGGEKYVFKNIFLSSNYFLKNLNKIYLNINMVLYFLFFLKNKNNIIIHCHSVNYLPLIIFIKTFFKNKVYLSLGGTDLYKLLKKKIVLNLLRRFDSIFVISKNFKELLANNNIQNVINHENGVDQEIFHNFAKEKKNSIVCVSNIRPVKGIENLIHAFKLLKQKEISDLNLIIVGKIYYDDYFRRIKKLISQFQIEKKIIFTNTLNQNEISKILNYSKISLLSSQSEGFPKVVIESISCLTPVISTDVGNVREVIKNCGIIVPVNDPIQFSEAIYKLLNDKLFYQNCVSNCAKLGSRYSWKNIVEIIDNAYDK